MLFSNRAESDWAAIAVCKLCANVLQGCAFSLSVGDESGNEGLTYGQLSFARAAVLLQWGIDHEVSHDRRRPVVVGLPLRYVALPDNLVVVLASVSIDTTFCLWLLRTHLRVILHPNLVRADLKR